MIIAVFEVESAIVEQRIPVGWTTEETTIEPGGFREAAVVDQTGDRRPADPDESATVGCGRSLRTAATPCRARPLGGTSAWKNRVRHGGSSAGRAINARQISGGHRLPDEAGHQLVRVAGAQQARRPAWRKYRAAG